MRPLSDDLRKRVIDAVDGGMSRRAAAERFGVAVSTAIRWVERWHAVGSHQPRPQGGDKRSHHVEVHAPEILALVEEDKDITLAEIATHIEDRHGRRFASTSIQIAWCLSMRLGQARKWPAFMAVPGEASDAGRRSHMDIGRPLPLSAR